MLDYRNIKQLHERTTLKLKAIISTISLLSLLSVILLPFNIAKVKAEDTTWYKDYDYTTDPSSGTLTLTKCTATDKEELTVYGTVTIDGVKYNNVIIENINNGQDGFWKSDADSLKSLSINPGDNNSKVKIKAGSLRVFSGLKILQSLDVSGIDTSEMKDMSAMFSGDEALRVLDLRQIDTSNVINASYMFDGCKGLYSMDLSSFDTSKMVSVNYMFKNVASNVILQDLDLRNFNFDNMSLTDRKKMFEGASITNIYLPKANTSKNIDFSLINNLYRVYYGGTEEEWNTLNNTIGSNSTLISGYNTVNNPVEPKVSNPATDNWYESYYYCLDKINYRLILFYYIGSGVSSINIPAYTRIDGVTYNTVLCNYNYRLSTSPWSSIASSVTGITLESGVTLADDCSFLFSGFSKLTKVNMSGVNTSNVVCMNSLFYNDPKLSSLDITGMSTSNVKYMKNMFNACKWFTSLDLSGLEMKNADVTGFLTSATYLKDLYLNKNAMQNYNFSGLTKLEHIYYAGSQTDWAALGNTIGSQTTVTYNYSTETPKIAVMFDGNGGTASATGITVEYGGTYGTLPTATRADYSFAGWYTAADGGTLVTSDTQVTNEASHTLYAHWTKNVVKATVTFNANGGSVSTGTKEVVFGEAYGTLPVPTKTGYTFNGWYTSTSNGSLVTEATTVTTSSSHTLYAMWTEVITEVSVSLNANGSGATVTPGSVKVKIGGTYGNLPTPVLEDYKFTGWYTSSTGGTLVTSTTKLISNTAHTLYAHWEKAKVTVYFDANGGSVTDEEKKVTIGEAYGTLPVPTRKDYIFDGWYTEDVGGDKVSAETIVTNEEEHYLYAHWVHDTVIVSFYAYEGAEITSKEYMVGSKYGELPSPVRSGYVLNGWYTQSNGGGELITAESDVIGEDAITIYAYWVKSTVTVKFNANGGTVSSSSKEIDFGGAYGELPKPARDGYNFNGWYTESAGGTKVTSETTLVKNTEHTLYAHWDKIVTVSFDGNGNGDPMFNNNLTVGQKYGELTAPTRSGYDFVGWYTEKNGGDIVTADTVVTNGDAHVLYAHWIKQTITVTFIGGMVSSVNPSSKELATGETYGILPQLSMDGYEFKGWYTDATGGELITSGTTVTKVSDHYLFAQWKKEDIQVQVSFDGVLDDVENIPGNRMVTVGLEYGDMSSPTKSGYDFVGWYTERTGGERINADTVVDNENSHILYAHWTKKSILVTFIGNKVDSVTSQTVTYGEKYGQLPVLKADGYEFKGWYTEADGGSPVNSETTVTNVNDHYLYAQWKKEEFKVTVSFDGNGNGDAVFNKTLTVGQKYGELTAPTRSGYDFVGWYTEKTSGVLITEDKIVENENSHILYAHWVKKNITVTFIDDKVTSVSPQTVTYGEVYGDLPKVEYTGYVFQGWYTEVTGGELITSITKVTKVSDHYLYAQWKKATVQVSFAGNGDGVEEIPDKTFTVGEVYGELSSPTRSGYSFDGWYTKASGGDKIEASTKVDNANAHILYAHWIKKTITVTLNGDKITEVDPITVTPGGKYDGLPELSLTGYEFDGWYTEAVGGSNITTETTVTAVDNHTLFAHWTVVDEPTITTITVSFDGNGDSVTSVPSNRSYTYGDKYGTIASPTRTNYTFDGWYTEKESGTKITSESLVKNKNSHVLYAHWIKTTVKVTFNGDIQSEVTPKYINATPGKSYGESGSSLPVLTSDDYEFLGWYTEAVGGDKITDTSIVLINTDHFLFAHWKEKVKKVNVIFDGNGDDVNNVPETCLKTVGDTYGELAVPQREGYDFEGWYTEAEAGGHVTKNTIVTNEKSHILYAHWKKKTITVTFNGDKVDDITPNSIEVVSGEQYGVLPKPTLTGYIFNGWYNKASGGNRITEETIVREKTDHILFAQWTEENKKVNVFFDGNANGVSGVPGNVVLTVGEKYGTMADPEKEGYDFEGWYTDKEEGVQITENTIVTNDISHVLYAHWSKKTITVKFNGDKVADIDPKYITVESGKEYGELPKPTLAGYTFKGWYTAAIGGELITESTTVSAKNDHILFAQWVEVDKQVSVSFAGNADSVTNIPGSITVTVGQKYGEMAEPERDGYKFDGWYTMPNGGERIDADTEVTNDNTHILYAHWTKASVIVTFNGGLVSDVSPANMEVKPGETYGKNEKLPEPTLDGYNFLGWYTEPSGGEKIDNDTMVKVKNDHILFAQWKEVSRIITVSFSGNGDDVINVPENRTLTVGLTYGTMTAPQRDGFEFEGWYTEPDGGSLVNENTTVLNEYSHTLYAHWIQQQKKVVVIFNPNRGTVDEESKKVTLNETYGELPTATRDKYRFDGWYTSATGGEQVTEDTIVTNENTHTLYAQWYEKDKKIMVYFSANGGTVKSAGKEVEAGLLYGDLPNATKEGYIFDGWYTKAEGGVRVTPETKVTQKLTHTLYAHWADLYKKVWVSFNANGGIISPESEEFSVGLTYNGLPVPARTGYRFDGWYTSMEDGERITDDSIVVNDEPHTLYAYWTNENDIISVTFNANGGTVDKHEMTIVVGKPYGELPTPQLDGMEFAGWYTEVEAGELVTAETIVNVDVAHTLFARWRQPESGNPDGGEVVDPIPVVPDAPPTPSDPGTGDSTGGQAQNTDTQVDNQSKVAAVNTVISDKNNTGYKVTSSDENNPTVSYAGNKLKSKTITVPGKVTIDGITYTVTKIEPNAFKNNKNLTKIVINKNVIAISKNAFKGCKKLKLIIVKSTKLTDKSVAKGAFKGVSKKVKIKVPKKKLTAYKKLFRKRGLSAKVKIVKG